MTLFAGHQIGVGISEALVSPSFSTLKGTRNVRWRIEHVWNEAEPVREDNWSQYSGSSLRRLTLGLELHGMSHTAQARIKNAALLGTAIRAKLTLADGKMLEVTMQVERYEETAREDDALEVEVSLTSTGVVTITG